MDFKSLYFKRMVSFVLSILFVLSPTAYGQQVPGPDYTAFDVYQMMMDQSINMEAQEIPVRGTDGSTPVTFGAEKEGSSSKILKVMSPNKEVLALFLGQEKNREFANQFIKEFLAGKHRQKNVVDSEGKVVELLPLNESLKSFNWSSATQEEFSEAVKKFVEIFPKSPFSFMDTKSRMALFRQDGPTTSYHKDGYEKWQGYKGLKLYDSWEPLLGEGELYIEHGHREVNGGWEVIFKPQRTYGAFEKMQVWFRTLMGSHGTLFEAPGHQRVVMPMMELPEEENKDYRDRVAEVSRMIQAYVVLRGLKGRTGLLGARHKALATDSQVATLDTGRGPLRLEVNRFYTDSVGVEFRVGMKDEVVRRFVQAVYTSRLSRNDMKDIAPLTSYSLLPGNRYESGTYVQMHESAAQRLNIPLETVEKAIANYKQVSKKEGQALTDPNYLLPLWQWESAPFLKGKAEDLKRISRDFIVKLSEMQNPSYKQISNLLAAWVDASDLTRDIEKYLTPTRQIDKVTSPLTVKIKEGGIDVNKIDLGNEFTARMPLKLKAEYDKNGVWTSSVYDMTPESREAKIKAVAESIKENFTGSREGVVKLNEAAHGHSLALAFNFQDAQNRTWRVEWDGISRNYDTDGNLVEGSARGGHIEIVSPKYNPTMNDVQGVYSAMEKEGVIPDYKMGGSHINIDYELFEKNPAAMARFLALFHSHRAIIAFMFQHMNRLRSAEPVEVSQALDMKLRNFKGTPEDLAKLLYEEKYFNQRHNRKTRYTQIDVSNFMGRVIPEQFILPDFDVVKARFTGGQGWAQQFRVTKHKKMEMRLFDAAANPLEAAFQMKVVRALLNKALNETAPVTGKVQTVDYEAYIKNPKLAYEALDNMAKDLDLKVEDYMPYVMNKLVVNKAYMQSKFYVPWKAHADKNYPKVQDWGKPVKARSLEGMLYSDRPIPPPSSVAPAAGGGGMCSKVFM
ncbi:amidoligase family protein [Bdellovibrio sp. HCB337]|uniref:amidoligase family protein n=1 Tax=Bdellovibrio sp. HCB337 TaxID=3394358 RepID=UPI0039A49383